MGGLRLALAMFTILPVPRPWHSDASPATATSAVRWLPLVGALLGGLAGLPCAAVLGHDRQATFLCAALGVAGLALLSRGLHLDGLADTADGLGSRAPGEQALAIMRRSDIGPFGVVTLVLVLVMDIAALTSIAAGGVWRPAAALATAAATGRLAVAHAAVPGVVPARDGGFGALVAGGTGRLGAAALTVPVLAGGAALAALVHANPVGWAGAQAVALAIVVGLRGHATRRLGGITGDVFGALVEITTTLVLVGAAVAA